MQTIGMGVFLRFGCALRLLRLKIYWGANVETKITPNRKKKKQQRQDVFQLRNPGDRFNVERVDGEQNGSDKTAGQRHAVEYRPKKQAIDDVQ